MAVIPSAVEGSSPSGDPGKTADIDGCATRKIAAGDTPSQ